MAQRKQKEVTAVNEQQDMPEQEAGSESILQKIVQLLDENRTDDLQSVIEGLSEEDLTHILESLDADHMPKFFGCLDKEAAADVFVLLNSDTQKRILKDFSDVKLQEVTDELIDDDVDELFESMPTDVVH